MSTKTSPPSACWRICFCNSTPFWGGGEHWHLQFASLMQQRGHEVTLIAAEGGKLHSRARERFTTHAPPHAPEIGPDVRPMKLGRLSFLNPVAMAALTRHFGRQRPHAVILGLPQDLKAAGQAARLSGVPAVIYRRGMGLPVRNTAFNRHLYRRVADAVIVNAEDTRRALFARNSALLPPERVHLLHNALHPSWLEHAPTTPVDGVPLRIGTAGRLVEQKGHRLLLLAAAELQQRGVDFELRIAGHGPLEQELRSLAGKLGIEARVRFLGFVQDVRSFLAEQDVFAFPSLWEGMGNAVLEAMACARPVVGFDLSSMPEVVRHGQTGLLAPAMQDAPQMASGLADCLEELAHNPSMRKRMGHAGRELVQKEFSLDSALERFEAILATVLESKGHTR